MSGLVALAFAAGMLAPLNPCGFALLPTWISHTLGDSPTAPLPTRLIGALRAGVALTVGFTGTLTLVGLAISAGARTLIHAAPWLGLATGLALLLFGAFFTIGRTLRLPATKLTPRSNGSNPGAGRMLLFGVGYAAASLSCTLGVLLAVIAQAITSATGIFTVFAAYTAGAASILLLVSVTTAAAGVALSRRLTGLARYTNRLTAAIMIATGAYLAWYWYPVATGNGTTDNALARLSAHVSTWVQSHTLLVAAGATAIVLTAAGLAFGRRRRHDDAAPEPVTELENCCTTPSKQSVSQPHD